MKKMYQKPTLFCEELVPEEMLCGCALRNPQFNEVQQCGYAPPNVPAYLNVRIFAEQWADCNMKGNEKDSYCYHAGAINLFSS